MQIYTRSTHPKGHIIHRNLFIENPHLVADGTNEYEFAGKVYKRVSIKTEINPRWSIDKTKEEHAYALANKILNIVDPPQSPRFGQLIPYKVNYYLSQFTDGTTVKIKEANYEWQNGKRV